MHLIIPFAYSSVPGCLETLRQLQLPNLQRLLAHWQPDASDSGPATSLSPPHERAWAGALWPQHNFADGLLPLAAWDAQHRTQPLGAVTATASDGAVRESAPNPADQAWAWVSPCHWQIGTAQIIMDAPEALQLSPEESQALCAALAPWFEQDGLQLHYHQPTRWLAQGALLRQLRTASLDRVVGSEVGDWMPDNTALRRLLSEMQMLLYNLPLNDERVARGALPVNSWWLSGCGAVPPNTSAISPAPQMADALRAPALAHNWQAWAQAWQQLDRNDCASLLQAAAAGTPCSLTLCGEHAAQRWQPGQAGWGAKVRGLFGRKSLPDILSLL